MLIPSLNLTAFLYCHQKNEETFVFYILKIILH